jgi:hypothetical protein
MVARGNGEVAAEHRLTFIGVVAIIEGGVER